jgi:hypothetical protein
VAVKGYYIFLWRRKTARRKAKGGRNPTGRFYENSGNQQATARLFTFPFAFLLLPFAFRGTLAARVS